MARFVQFVIPGLLLLLFSSCSSAPEIAPVRGTVSKAGRPLKGVMVTFMPDPQQGTDGAVSTAITDHDGQYELIYRGGDEVKGALVGHHRVVVKDFAQENAREESTPPSNRVPQVYRLAARTPLSYEVLPQTQAINIELSQP